MKRDAIESSAEVPGDGASSVPPPPPPPVHRQQPYEMRDASWPQTVPRPAPAAVPTYASWPTDVSGHPPAAMPPGDDGIRVATPRVRPPKSGSAVLAARRRPSKLRNMVAALAPGWNLRGPAALLQSAPSWLISLLIHMLLLVLLALWWLPDLRSNALRLSATFSDTLGDQMEFDTVEIGAPEEELEAPVVTPEELPPVEAPLLAPPTPAVTELSPLAGAELSIPDVGFALTGREAGMKEVLLAAYGGNERTEAAVTAGLEWLRRNQMRDGSWSLTGPYSDGGQIENPTAATAMALLAFQGAGHTHLAGTHQAAVKRGVAALLKMQDRNGNFYRGGVSHHRLYSQAQAMIAVCELYGMTKDSMLRTAAERSVEYAVKSQDQLGGWRYQPGFDSDTSVTGWFVMGLQSARMAGLEVPRETLDNVGSYLDRAGSADLARYGYQPGMEPTFAMTAEALLCRQYLGWSRGDQRLLTGVNMIRARPISWDDRDVYYWYYATQVLHHLEGLAWEEWNGVMREVLPAEQTMEGRERGSWAPMGDRWGPHGGRLYVTCLSLYMLEVYYRHLPLYAGQGK